MELRRTLICLVAGTAFACSSPSTSSDGGAGGDAGVAPDGGASSDAGALSDAGGSDAGPADGGCTCDALTTGLCTPLTTCSAVSPCDDGNGNPPITTPETNPSCSTNPNLMPARPLYTDTLLTWTDAVTSDPRAACVFTPDGGQRVPLLFFFHGSLASANMVYDDTSLRTKAISFPLGSTTGFALASMQGQNIHWPDTHNEGAHHDFFFRDPSTASGNPDFRAADHVVDALVAQGSVDPARIFAVGWSNGAFFAQEYAVARHATPTPAGNYVAAAAVYAGADPYNNTTGSQSPTCQLATYPSTQVPVLLVHRDCDAQVACNEAQRASFSLPPGFHVEEWLSNSLWGVMGDAAATGAVTVSANQTWQGGGDLLLDAAGAQAASCQAAASCTLSAGNANHHAWPDGVADGSGVDWEPTLLTFLQKHHR